MNWLILLSVAAVGSFAKAYSYKNFPTLFENNIKEKLLGRDIDKQNGSFEIEDGNQSKKQEDIIIAFPQVNTSETFYHVTKEGNEIEDKPSEGQEDEVEILETLTKNLNRHHQVVPEYFLLDQILKIHRTGSKDNEENVGNGKINTNSPMRRQINSWQDFSDFLDTDNQPWNYDIYHAQDSFAKNEYIDYTNTAAFSTKLKNTTSPHKSNTEFNPHYKSPQYYQKNYYYNYYPVGSSKKYLKGSKEEKNVEEANRKQESFSSQKYYSKNPCKQYLRFLKYAFEKLDESEEYRYDYDSNIYDTNHWMEENPSKYRMFTTNKLGPTFYIDNAAKMSQTKGIDKIPGTRAWMVSDEPGDNFWKKYSTLMPIDPSIQTYTKSLPPGFMNYGSGIPTTVFPWGRATLNPYYFQGKLNEESRQSALSESTNRKEEGYGDDALSKKNVLENSPLPEKNAEEPNKSEDYDYNSMQMTPFQTTNSPFSTKNYNENLVDVGYRFLAKENSEIPSTTIFTENQVVNTVSPFEDSGDSKDENVDCNDKMLPCPDTFNLTYPLNGYCNRYVSCESGQAIRRTCPEGLHFNIITKSCDLPHNSFCAYVCPKPNGYYGIPGDCNGYFLCKNSVLEYRMCPSKMHWDAQKEMCTFPELSSCPMRCSNLNEIKPYKGDCKAYVICLGGVPYYHKCPPKTEFDQIMQSCIPKHTSKCKDDVKLMTESINPNSLCTNVFHKIGSNIWCDFVNQNKSKAK